MIADPIMSIKTLFKFQRPYQWHLNQVQDFKLEWFEHENKSEMKSRTALNVQCIAKEEEPKQ